MSTLKFVSATALCGLLAGCGNAANGWYVPIAGVQQTETAPDAYRDCVWRDFARESANPASWTGGAVGGAAYAVAAAPEQHAFMHACMGEKGWLTKPGYEPPA